MDGPSPAGAHRAGTAIVLGAGGAVDPRVARGLPAADLVVAADSGLAQAAVLGLHVDLVVGDLDSVEPAMLDDARATGARVERHPSAKDEIDLELAIDAACTHGASYVVVVTGAGGRMDMLLANALVLAQDRYAHLRIDAWTDRAHSTLARGPGRADVHGRAGELVSLLALNGVARGVRTEGLQYPLHHEDLHPGSGRGVSNVLLDAHAAVELDAGVLLVIRPDALDALDVLDARNALEEPR